MKYYLQFSGLYPRNTAFSKVVDLADEDLYNEEAMRIDGDRPLTPAETAAYLLGAPASSFPVEAPKDEELPS